MGTKVLQVEGMSYFACLNFEHPLNIRNIKSNRLLKIESDHKIDSVKRMATLRKILARAKKICQKWRAKTC